MQAETGSAELRRQLADLLQEQRRLIDRLQGDQAYFQQLARSVWRVQEDERRRIANELHDGVGHNIAAVIHLVANALAPLRAAHVPAPALEALERAHAIAESTLQDTRAMSRLLRPQILDDLGLEAALRWLVRNYAQTRGIEAKLAFEPSPQPLDGDRATIVFRVAQEALANAARHADATRVEIGFDGSRGARAQLRVADDGRGCDLAAALARGSAGSSSGLGGMRDRVRLFDGSLRFDSAPGQGFTLELELPLHDPPARPAA